MSEYIMKRTDILCPNCFKGKLIHEKAKEAYCDQCGQQFVFTDENNRVIKYK